MMKSFVYTRIARDSVPSTRPNTHVATTTLSRLGGSTKFGMAPGGAGKPPIGGLCWPGGMVLVIAFSMLNAFVLSRRMIWQSYI